YLAALINAPTTLDPYLNYEGLTARQKVILDRMKEFGFLESADYQVALSDTVEFLPRQTVLKYPYFSFFIRDLLVQELGQEVVDQGLNVYTTLDPTLQEQAMDIVAKQVKHNSQKWKASNA